MLQSNAKKEKKPPRFKGREKVASVWYVLYSVLLGETGRSVLWTGGELKETGQRLLTTHTHTHTHTHRCVDTG